MDNNIFEIAGRVEGDLTLSHICLGEKFFEFYLSTARQSGVIDFVKCIISERAFAFNLKDKDFVKIKGECRTKNESIEGKNKLHIYLFVQEIEPIDYAEEMQEYNQLSLDGYLCKPPIFRKTPRGREIGECILAVNRKYGKTDYIPFICWGRNGRFLNTLEVGTRLKISGRLQSREYEKVISEEVKEKRIAYEMSVTSIDVVEVEPEPVAGEESEGIAL